MSLVIFPRQFGINASASIAQAAYVNVFDANSSTPRTAYTTAAMNVAHLTDITSDAAGLFPAIYVNPAGGDYKLVFKTAAGVTVWTEDNLSALGNPAEPYYEQTDAELAASVTPTNYFSITRPEITPLRFGATGDGSTDDTTALQNWLTVLGRTEQTAWGVLEGGTYKHTANLTVPANVNIVGAGSQYSILKPSAAVTIALTLSNNANVSRLMVNGSSTTNATGLKIAPTLPDYNEVEDVWVQNFGGASGIGILIKESVSLACRRINALSNGTNVKISSASPSASPTTVSFDSCKFRSSTVGPGVQIDSGQNIQFVNNCIFENNIAEGLLANTIAAGIIRDLLVSDSWFESNYAGHVDTGTKVYSLKVVGTTAAANAHLRNIAFSQGSSLSDRKSVLIKDASATWSKLRCAYGFAYDFVIEGASSYVILDKDSADRMGRFISNPNAATVYYPLYVQVYDNADGTSVLPNIEKVSFPTYSASMTFDASSADEFAFSANNGTAFTINAPTKPRVGQLITIRIKNTSGGALGAVTWNAIFKMSAWTQPANGFQRSITFRYDSSNWVQESQTGVDVPN